MHSILNSEGDFDVNAFDEIVAVAFDAGNPHKNEAEGILLKFKGLNNSWTKVDFILKNSKSQQSKFIALQVLEESVKHKWSLFDETMKNGIRQYVFSCITNSSHSAQSDIILQKFNMILVNIVKKDWPKRWPTFISDLINISQSTNMTVCTNALEILRTFNEQAFLQADDLTTAKRRRLFNALQQEHEAIFSFLTNILTYSEKQDLDTQLLKNCLGCFGSFCKSTQASCIFTTRAIDIICNHLNSSHSIEVLQALLDVTELFAVKDEHEDTIQINIPSNFDTSLVYAKVNLIHRALLSFFSLYMSKFGREDELPRTYRKFDREERIFIKAYARCFCSIYYNFFGILEYEENKKGLLFLVNISKINDADLFREIFPTWKHIIGEFYAEYPMRSNTAKPLSRMRYNFVLVKLFPALINFMPRPQEVFVKVNELGEVVQDKNIQTVEIEFCRKMKEVFYYLSFCIQDEITKHLVNECQKHMKKIEHFDFDYFNKLCWTIGAFANTFEQKDEESFFYEFMDIILSFCEYVKHFDQTVIVSSNLMYLIGQYQRFHKNNLDFTLIAVRKLFEFMQEEFVGVKEMAVDCFLRIAENCPMQFFRPIENSTIFDQIMLNMDTLRAGLGYTLQRIFVEALFSVLRSNRIQDEKYATRIMQSFADHRLLIFSEVGEFDFQKTRAVCHMFKCYALGYTMIPGVFRKTCNKTDVVAFYVELARNQGRVQPNFTKITKEAIVELLIEVAQAEQDDSFYNMLVETVLLDYANTKYPTIIRLARVVLEHSSDAFYVQRVLFVLNNVLVPSVPLVKEADQNPDVSVEFVGLLGHLISSPSLYSTNFAVLMASDHFQAIYSAVLSAVGCMREVSLASLLFLQQLMRVSFENKNQPFFSKYFMITLENCIGLIIDKDTRQNHRLQVALFYEMVAIVKQIQPISQNGSNRVVVSQFITGLFSSAFPNITAKSLECFIRGIFEIRSQEAFTGHVDDFTVKIDEYGTDEDLDDELAILEERIAQGGTSSNNNS